MSNHTKEPWHVRTMGNDCFITAAIEPGMAYGPEIMGDDYTGYGDAERKAADARRIVACVNACAGIRTAELEFQQDLGSKYLELKQQRDELVAALRTIRSMDSRYAATNMYATKAEEICEAALANVKS